MLFKFCQMAIRTRKSSKSDDISYVKQEQDVNSVDNNNKDNNVLDSSSESVAEIDYIPVLNDGLSSETSRIKLRNFINTFAEFAGKLLTERDILVDIFSVEEMTTKESDSVASQNADGVVEGPRTETEAHFLTHRTFFHERQFLTSASIAKARRKAMTRMNKLMNLTEEEVRGFLEYIRTILKDDLVQLLLNSRLERTLNNYAPIIKDFIKYCCKHHNYNFSIDGIKAKEFLELDFCSLQTHAVSIETLKQAQFALTFQSAIMLFYGGHESQPMEKLLNFKNYMKTKRQDLFERDKEIYKDSATLAQSNSFKIEDHIENVKALYEETIKKPHLAFMSLLELSLSLTFLFHGEVKRRLELRHLAFIEVKLENVMTFALQITTFKDKTNKANARRDAYGARHMNYLTCPFGILAFAFEFRFGKYREDMPFDVTENSKWFDHKLLYHSNPTHEITYTYERKLYETVDSIIEKYPDKKTHSGRKIGAVLADDYQIPVNAIAHGQWTGNSLSEFYLPSLSKEFLVKEAIDYQRDSSRYLVVRAELDPPLELQKKIFPFADAALKSVENNPKKPSAQNFMRLLIYLRKVFIQDLICFRMDNQPNLFSNHKITTSELFLDYEKRLTDHIKKVSQEQEEIRQNDDKMQAEHRMLQRQLDAMRQENRRIQEENKRIQEEIKRLQDEEKRKRDDQFSELKSLIIGLKNPAQSSSSCQNPSPSPPVDDNTQIVHPRVIHPARGVSKARLSLPLQPPNYPNGTPCKPGEGTETVPLLMKEFDHLDSCVWRKSDKERKYIQHRRFIVEYVRISSADPIVKEYGQVDLLEFYRNRLGLKLLKLARMFESFSEASETAAGRCKRTFTSASKERVDDLLRDFVTSGCGVNLTLTARKRPCIGN